MKTYKSSALSNKGRAKIFEEAKANGVIIQECNTNGDVRCEYVLTTKDNYDYIDNKAFNCIING